MKVRPVEHVQRCLKASIFVGLFFLGTSTAGATAASSAVSKNSAAIDQHLLTKIGLQSSDVPTGLHPLLIPGGNQVRNQVTLDLCGARFPSEALRVARRQLTVVSSTSSLGFSTEAVLYRNTSATRQTFLELRRAAAGCPTKFVPPDVAGVPPLKTVFGPTPDVTWPATPGVERLAFSETVSDAAGYVAHSTGVYLRRGPLLLGLYWTPNTTVVPIDGQATIEGIEKVFEGRLASVTIPSSISHSS